MSNGRRSRTASSEHHKVQEPDQDVGSRVRDVEAMIRRSMTASRCWPGKTGKARGSPSLGGGSARTRRRDHGAGRRRAGIRRWAEQRSSRPSRKPRKNSSSGRDDDQLHGAELRELLWCRRVEAARPPAAACCAARVRKVKAAIVEREVNAKIGKITAIARRRGSATAGAAHGSPSVEVLLAPPRETRQREQHGDQRRAGWRSRHVTLTGRGGTSPSDRPRDVRVAGVPGRVRVRA
jgi:hypothetical protein